MYNYAVVYIENTSLSLGNAITYLRFLCCWPFMKQSDDDDFVVKGVKSKD